MLKNYLIKLFAVAVLVMAWGGVQSQTTITITEPASIANDYEAVHAAFGPYLGGQTAPLVLIDDGTGATTGCVPASNDLTGAIALIDRGVCGFTTKAAFAELGGAIAVIVCNNDMANPDAILFMGNAPGDPLVCELGIPAVMVSFNTCQTIKAELANGVTAALPDEAPLDGEDITTAIPLPGAGTYTATELTGTGATNIGLTDAVAAQVYSIVAPSDGVMNVNSCLGGVDTRVLIMSGCRNSLTLLGEGDDECELAPGDPEFASSVDVQVTAGQEYLIMWLDTWESFGFDFTVSFGALPIVNVTFNVDMNNETVDPTGVKIAGSFSGWNQEDMTDNGDGTWSYTATVTAGDVLFWKYLNGTDGWEPSGDLATCGVDDGFGGFNRAGQVPLVDVSAPLVCFASCFPCPSDEPTDCAAPFVLISEDFESYNAGDPIVDVSDDWINWPANGVASSLVSNAQASSGSLSLAVVGVNNPGATTPFEDPILVLGGQISGNYRLGWAMYIPVGNAGYFNIQHFDDMFGAAAGGEWAAEMFLELNGAGSISVNSVSYPFSYPNGDWFDVAFNVDVTNDWVTMYINNVHVLGWQLSLQSNAGASAQSLGAINFFPRSATDLYYIDDIYYEQIPPAADGNGYCHVATPIDLGVHTMTGADCFGGPDQTNAPAAAWYAYTAAADGYCFIASCEAGSDSRVWIFNSCDMRGTIGVNDDECAMMAGSTTDLYASIKEFAVTAGETYYIAWDNRWLADGETHDFELGFFTDEFAGDFCQTAIDIDLGTHSFDSWGFASQSGPVYGAAGDNTPYTRSKWFAYTPTENTTVRLYNCDLAVQDTRAWIYVGECGTYESLQLVVGLDDECGTQEDFTWDAVAGTTYYIEWDDKGEDIEGHDWILEGIVPTVAVTFQVDLTPYLEAGNALETVRIAGNFADNGAIGVPNWDPPSAPAFTHIGDDVYSATIEFPASSAGQNLEFKFLNTATSWGECGLQQECLPTDAGDCKSPGNDNRLLVLPSTDQALCYTWETCLGCNVVNVMEQIELPMTIAPNPFSNRTVVSFHTPILEGQVRLTALTGQLVRTYRVNGPQLIIENDGLVSGVYFLNVVTESGTSVAQKLIVE